MGTPYIGEIRMFGGNFAPAGWAFCAGQTMAISENETLFNLIGTTYGGDGQETFMLPSLGGRIPVCQGPNYTMGQAGGSETVTLTTQQMPIHNHAFVASTATATNPSPNGELHGDLADDQFRRHRRRRAATRRDGGPAPGRQPAARQHEPYLAISFIISLYGVYPTQT